LHQRVVSPNDRHHAHAAFRRLLPFAAKVLLVSPDHHRSDRVAAAMREEIATFLANDVKDPRVAGLVTVTAVEITRDLRHARVFVSVLGTDAQRSATFEGLASIATHLRGRVGRALRLRVAPEIDFRNDESIAHAAHLEQLLAQVRRDSAAGNPAPDSSSPDDEGRGS
jgi:ribosome-binding factor A